MALGVFARLAAATVFKTAGRIEQSSRWVPFPYTPVARNFKNSSRAGVADQAGQHFPDNPVTLRGMGLPGRRGLPQGCIAVVGEGAHCEPAKFTIMEKNGGKSRCFVGYPTDKGGTSATIIMYFD